MDYLNLANIKRHISWDAFIKERKAEVASGKYGMTQIVLKPNLEVYTMSPQNFFNTYQNISSNSSYKSNRQCDYGYRQSGFVRNRSLETLKFEINKSPVQVYPNGAHNPPATYLCITKDGLGYEVFNVSNDNNSVDLYNEKILKRFYPNSKLKFEIGSTECLFSNRKLKEELDFKPQNNWVK